MGAESRTSATSSFRVLAAIAPLLVLIAALSACSSSKTPGTVVVTATSGPGARVQTRAGQLAVNPYPVIPGKVAVYIQPPSARAIFSGQPFAVQLVLVNGLGRSFAVPGSCSGWLAAGLSSSTITYQPAYAAVACASDYVPVGLTRFRRTVLTTYSACSQDRNAAHTPNFPACSGHDHDQMPALPAGEYHLQLDTSNIPHALVHPAVSIDLIKA